MIALLCTGFTPTPPSMENTEEFVCYKTLLIHIKLEKIKMKIRKTPLDVEEIDKDIDDSMRHIQEIQNSLFLKPVSQN